jgi:hypothetical protein
METSSLRTLKIMPRNLNELYVHNFGSSTQIYTVHLYSVQYVRNEFTGRNVPGCKSFENFLYNKIYLTFFLCFLANVYIIHSVRFL